MQQCSKSAGENSDFDSIMRKITSGFTGDPAEDIPYLREKSEEYHDHVLSCEISRACGRLIYEMLPDDKKVEINKALGNEKAGTQAALEEIRYNIYKKDYDKALQMTEALVKKAESLNAFQDDQVSQYFVFDEVFEEVLYDHRYKPTRDLRNAPFPYTEMYAIYGSLLVELGRLEDARAVLQKGLRWNPMNFYIMSEYVETFKMEGDMDTFREKTMEAFRIAIHAPQVARCFRNLGYYYVEKKLYSVAMAAYFLSMRFEKDSKQVQSELFYINQVAGVIKPPSYEEAEKYAKKHGFPMDADSEVLGLAYTYGKHYMEEGKSEPARYFLGILYELTRDDDVKRMIDTLPEGE